MVWQTLLIEKPILTDSGGFQIMSLSNLVKTNEKGSISFSP